MKKHACLLTAMALGVALILAGCSHEGADWKSAKSADTTEAYQQFLAQHPNSANAPQARTRVAQLQEQHDWQATTSADTREAYERFLTQHADSKWAQEARIRIENFAQSGSANAANTANAASAAGTAAVAATARASAASASKPHASASSGSHYVQLGAFRSEASAASQWKRLSVRYARELGARTPHYVAGHSKRGKIVRLEVGVESRGEAKALCAKLKAHAQSCLPVSAG
ncbi:MAG TPA: SPOR domain-containing protein [Steroidobacteraceae bacterium]|nr:SPOR domain-containing protein [Steroidobacteraceae bacterium]